MTVWGWTGCDGTLWAIGAVPGATAAPFFLRDFLALLMAGTPANSASAPPSKLNAFLTVAMVRNRPEDTARSETEHKGVNESTNFVAWSRRWRHWRRAQCQRQSLGIQSQLMAAGRKQWPAHACMNNRQRSCLHVTHLQHAAAVRPVAAAPHAQPRVAHRAHHTAIQWPPLPGRQPAGCSSSFSATNSRQQFQRRCHRRQLAACVTTSPALPGLSLPAVSPFCTHQATRELEKTPLLGRQRGQVPCIGQACSSTLAHGDIEKRKTSTKSKVNTQALLSNQPCVCSASSHAWQAASA